MTKNQLKVTELCFRYQAKGDSGEGILFDFLKNDEVLSHKEMILRALKAYWFPIALAKNNIFSEEEIEQAALRAIQELKWQINQIALVTGVELSDKSSVEATTPINGVEPNFIQEEINHQASVNIGLDEPLMDLGY